MVPFLLSGGDDVIEGLTITSDQPYPVEFIQIGSDGCQILDCDIYGPAQAGDSSTWVVNRGFVTQTGVSGLLVRGNIFHSLRQPAYLNPGSVGTIMGNVCYDTRGYVVDRAIFVFSGNSWGLPANAVDMALLSGTLTGAPYDPLSALEASNGLRLHKRPALSFLALFTRPGLCYTGRNGRCGAWKTSYQG